MSKFSNMDGTFASLSCGSLPSIGSGEGDVVFERQQPESVTARPLGTEAPAASAFSSFPFPPRGQEELSRAEEQDALDFMDMDNDTSFRRYVSAPVEPRKLVVKNTFLHISKEKEEDEDEESCMENDNGFPRFSSDPLSGKPSPGLLDDTPDGEAAAAAKVAGEAFLDKEDSIERQTSGGSGSQSDTQNTSSQSSDEHRSWTGVSKELPAPSVSPEPLEPPEPPDIEESRDGDLDFMEMETGFRRASTAPAARPSRVKFSGTVKHTFLEIVEEGDEDLDFMEDDNGFGRWHSDPGPGRSEQQVADDETGSSSNESSSSSFCFKREQPSPNGQPVPVRAARDGFRLPGQGSSAAGTASRVSPMCMGDLRAAGTPTRSHEGNSRSTASSDFKEDDLDFMEADSPFRRAATAPVEPQAKRKHAGNLKVKNTFLELAEEVDDDQDFMENDAGFPRFGSDPLPGRPVSSLIGDEPEAAPIGEVAAPTPTSDDTACSTKGIASSSNEEYDDDLDFMEKDCGFHRAATAPVQPMSKSKAQANVVVKNTFLEIAEEEDDLGFLEEDREAPRFTSDPIPGRPMLGLLDEQAADAPAKDRANEVSTHDVGLSAQRQPSTANSAPQETSNGIPSAASQASSTAKSGGSSNGPQSGWLARGVVSKSSPAQENPPVPAPVSTPVSAPVSAPAWQPALRPEVGCSPAVGRPRRQDIAEDDFDCMEVDTGFHRWSTETRTHPSLPRFSGLSEEDEEFGDVPFLRATTDPSRHDPSRMRARLNLSDGLSARGFGDEATQGTALQSAAQQGSPLLAAFASGGKDASSPFGQDVGWIARAASDPSAGLSMSDVEKVTINAIRNLPCAVTLADPDFLDCPLVGVSQEFETLTGFRRRDIIGYNCRFLNRGTGIAPNLRAHLRDSVQHSREFIGILPNWKKCGEKFMNFLHLAKIEVRGRKFMLGIQVDVTHVAADPRNPGHIEALKAAAERIFEHNIDAWVQGQLCTLLINLSIPYSQLLKSYAPHRFLEEQNRFVRLELSGSVASRGGFENQGDTAVDSDATAGRKARGSAVKQQMPSATPSQMRAYTARQFEPRGDVSQIVDAKIGDDIRAAQLVEELERNGIDWKQMLLNTGRSRDKVQGCPNMDRNSAAVDPWVSRRQHPRSMPELPNLGFADLDNARTQAHVGEMDAQAFRDHQGIRPQRGYGAEKWSGDRRSAGNFGSRGYHPPCPGGQGNARDSEALHPVSAASAYRRQ